MRIGIMFLTFPFDEALSPWKSTTAWAHVKIVPSWLIIVPEPIPFPGLIPNSPTQLTNKASLLISRYNTTVSKQKWKIPKCIFTLWSRYVDNSRTNLSSRFCKRISAQTSTTCLWYLSSCWDTRNILAYIWWWNRTISQRKQWNR